MDKTKRQLAEGILYTDFYQLTMAQLYYRAGLQDNTVQFDYFFRSYPECAAQSAGYCVNAGLEWFVEWMNSARFTREETDLLRGCKSKAGRQLFSEDFLNWLNLQGDFSKLELRAVPEGRVVHPGVPLVTVRGPLAMAQLLESSLLNHLNYQILIATKASRIREAASGAEVIDFGMRRAPDRGANAATRAALLGGVNFTSNTGISLALGYPPKGTHAHSLVQAFIALGLGELGAFRAYAQVYPDDCLFLVDTVNTLNSGVPNAIKVFNELKNKGHKPVGIRLDSGDLAYLSIQAAKMLDEAGFKDAVIVLSNMLDEIIIWQIITQIRQDAFRCGVNPDDLIRRLVYGVGSKLVSPKEGFIDGVYKLSAVLDNDKWLPAIKLSESANKVINPGCKNVWRVYDERGKATADLLSLVDEDPARHDPLVLRHPVNLNFSRSLPKTRIIELEPLLVDIIKNGRLVYNFPPVEALRENMRKDLDRLDNGVKRLINPHRYHISLSEGLMSLKQQLLKEAKGKM